MTRHGAGHRSLLGRAVARVAFVLAGGIFERGFGREYRESTERFRAAQELSPDGFCVLNPLAGPSESPEECRWVYANPAAERMIGRGPLVNQRVLDVLPGLRTHRDLRRLLEGGMPEPVEVFYDADGIRGWFRVSSLKMEGGIAVSFHDITARKEAERSLREREELFRRVVTDLPIPTVVHTAEGEILEVSRSFTRITGYTRDDVPDAETWLRKVCGVPEERLAEACTLLRAKRETVACHAKEEQKVRTIEGEERTWIMHVSHPQRLSTGRAVMASMAVDVTDVKRMEAELRNEEAQIRLMLAQMPCKVWTTDRDLRITSMQGGRSLSGWNAVAAVGTTLYERAGTRGDAYAPLPAHRRALAGEPAEYEHRPRGTDRVITARVEPLRSAQGVIGTVGVAVDTTERRQTEDALRASEERLRAMFDNVGVGIVEVEDDDRFVVVNDRACEILGRSRESLLTLTVHDVTWPEDRPVSDRLNAELHARQRDRVDYEKRYIRGDGTPVWTHVTTSALRNSEGRWVRSITTIQDISGRRAAEEALRESEDRFRRAVMAAPFPIMIHNEDGQVVTVNDAWTEISGYRSEDIPTLEAWTSAAYGEGKDAVQAGIARLFDFEERVSEGEFVIRTRSGEARTWALSSAPLGLDPRGRRLVISMAMDVTFRRQAEEALRAGEERLRLAVEATGLDVWEYDPQSEDVQCGDWVKALWGMSPDERYTLNDWLSRIHPDDRATITEELRRALDPKESSRHEMEYRVVAPDGSVRWMNVRTQTRCTEVDGEPRADRIIGTLQDVTERKRTEEVLRELNRTLEERVKARTEELMRSYEALKQSERLAALGQAMTVLSHESRNAIQNCLTALQVLRRMVGRDAKQLQYIESALKALDNLRRAYDDIRAYAAPMKLERSEVSVVSVWREAWTDLASRLVERQVLLVEPDCVDGVCSADPHRLKQVFRNLFENALDACPDPLEIRMACCEDLLRGRPALRVTVRDNGPGMNPAELERVLEPFFTRKAKGTGLGLAIVDRIVDAHGGTLEVRSAPGEGFEVALVLPQSGGDSLR